MCWERDNYFCMEFCNVTLQLSNLGVMALLKHTKYKKHLKVTLILFKCRKEFNISTFNICDKTKGNSC